MLSYLLAQARRQPLDTLRFAAGEVWRRGRLRWKDSLHHNLPKFSTGFEGINFAAFLPSVGPKQNEGQQRLRNLPFSERITSIAERARRHEFEIFGEWISLGPEIDWHRDWQTGYRWPLERVAGVSVLDSQAAAAPGTDIKRPWELGRFHHALALGQAFAATGDRAHSRAFAGQVRHWIRNNPYARGANWAMPMEVAIRAVNWITAAAFFKDGDCFDDDFKHQFLESLFLHGRHLAAHREWNPVARANHYLACVAGLLHLGIFFEQTPEGQAWLNLGRREVLAEMDNLVGDDGVAREGSSGYHCFIAEIFLACALLLVRSGASRPDSSAETRAAINQACDARYAGSLARMFAFVSTLCEGREIPPTWGDADDGRFLPFEGGGEGAVIPLARVGAALYGYVSPLPGPAVTAEIFWRLGFVPPAVSSDVRATQHEAFPSGGFFFFSSPRLRGSIRCGPLGAHGWSNHAHGDQLSMEFCCDGRPVVVDPGLPSYAGDPQARNLFRSTRYHNVVVLDGEEQNRFWPTLLFRIVDDTRSRLLRWDADSAGVCFSGEHFGYQRLASQAVVRREMRLNSLREILTLHDRLALRVATPLEWLFHLAPGISPERVDISAASPPNPYLNGRSGDGLAWNSAWRLGPVMLRVWSSIDRAALVARREDGWVAPRFGQKIPARILSFSGTACGDITAFFEFTVLGENIPSREALA
jgi:hypothetical protein